MIIFAGKAHQAALFKPRSPDDWVIGVTDNGWTTDQPALKWLYEVFEPHTKHRGEGEVGTIDP
jgi:hypothetical protein